MFIQNLDYISPKITLFHNYSDKHSSIISGILSIILTIFAFIFGYFLSLEFLFHKNPTSFYYKKLYNNLEKVNIGTETFFHFISISDRDNLNFSLYDKNIYSVFGIMDFDFKNFQNEDYFDNKTYWIYENCDYNDYKYYDLLLEKEEKEKILHSGCIKKMNKNGIIYTINDKKFEYPYLEKGINSILNRNYAIITKGCTNSTLNNYSCYSPEIIEKSISSFQNVYFNYFEYFVEVDDYKNPMKFIMSNFSYFFYEFNYFDIRFLNFHPIELRTNKGILFNHEKIDKRYKLYSDSVEYYMSDNPIRGVIILQLLNFSEIYDRTYKKLQDIAGGVDGIIEIFIFIFEFINSFFYHDFQLINDFNNAIEQKVIKIKYFSTLNSNKYGTILSTSNNNYNNKLLKKNLKVFSINDNLSTSKNYFKNTRINSYINKNENLYSSRKNEMNLFNKRLTYYYKKISWSTYFINRLKCINKNFYIKSCEKMRKEMLSEERLYKSYFDVKNLKEMIETNNNVQLKELENKNLKSLKFNDKKSSIY